MRATKIVAVVLLSLCTTAAGARPAGEKPKAAGEKPKAAGEKAKAAGEKPKAAGEKPKAAGEEATAGAETPASETPAAETPAAETTLKVEQLYAEGAALYKAGKYRAAIARFEKAHAIYPEPNLLYNMARCHEASGDVDRAIKHYQRFIDAEGAAPHIRDKARTRLKMLRKAAAGSAAERAATRPATPTSPAPTPNADSPGRSRAVAVTMWIMGGLALAAAAGGTAAYLLGNSDHAKVDDAISAADGQIVQMTRSEALTLQESGKTKKVAGIALWSAAGAALITSAVLFAVDRGPSEARADSKIDVSVAPSPSGGAMMISGRF